jgi:uncharacterized protein
MNKIFVFDTNSLISATLFKNTSPRFALIKAISEGKLAVSAKTLNEFMEVINRKKFDKYFINNEERLSLFGEIEAFVIRFLPAETITDCRDINDNKFLELAVECQASCIITSDSDLLVLHPFRNIPILNSVDFLAQF